MHVFGGNIRYYSYSYSMQFLLMHIFSMYTFTDFKKKRIIVFLVDATQYLFPLITHIVLQCKVRWNV